MSKTYDFLKNCDAFFVLSMDGDTPQGRPFGAIFEYDDMLYFTTSTMKNVYRQIKNNGNIQIVALKAATRNWIRVSGIATECKNYERKVQILNDCPMLKKHFSTPDCEYFAVFSMEIYKSELHKNNDIEIL